MLTIYNTGVWFLNCDCGKVNDDLVILALRFRFACGFLYLIFLNRYTTITNGRFFLDSKCASPPFFSSISRVNLLHYFGSYIVLTQPFSMHVALNYFILPYRLMSQSVIHCNTIFNAT